MLKRIEMDPAFIISAWRLFNVQMFGHYEVKLDFELIQCHIETLD